MDLSCDKYLNIVDITTFPITAIDDIIRAGKINKIKQKSIYASIYFIDQNFNVYNSYTSEDNQFNIQPPLNDRELYSTKQYKLKSSIDKLIKFDDIVMLQDISYSYKAKELIKKKISKLVRSLKKNKG